MSKEQDIEELQKGIKTAEEQLKMIEELKKVKTGRDFSLAVYTKKIRESMDNAIVNARTQDEYLRLLIQRFEHRTVLKECRNDDLKKMLEKKIEVIESQLKDADPADKDMLTQTLNIWNSLFLKRNLYKTMLEDLNNTDAKIEQLKAEIKDLENEIEELDKEEE